MMGTFLAGLIGISTTVLSRVLIALGMAVVTVTGVAAVVSGLKASVLASLGTAPVAILQLIGLGGGWTALGILFGAATTCVAFWTITKATSVLGVG